MDDLYALEGGSSATQWQKRHQKRKAREAAKKLRQIVRAEAKADLVKRTKKWRERLKTQAVANKAAGLPPPAKYGRPRDHRKKQWVDLTGQRFGRQTVIRVAPVSKNRGRNKRWWVRCDCGSGDRLVAGTNLRQGITLSCGCLRSEALRARKGIKRAQPLSVRMLTMAQKLDEAGDKKTARLLILGAKANAREERAKTKGLYVIQLRKPRKGKMAEIGIEDRATIH